MVSFETVRAEDGRFSVRVHQDDFKFVYETAAYATEEAAIEDAKRWLHWSDNLAAGNAESIYYILVIPDTWPGPPPGAHPFAGLHMKIGRTNNVMKRLPNLQTGASGELIIMALEPGNAAIEQERHRQFAEERRQGEWFVCSPELCRHAMRTWGRNNLLPPEHQRAMLRLADRIHAYRAMRHALGRAPDMVNPSINEPWHGNVFVDLVYSSIAKRLGIDTDE
jgi:hypothetical protein